MSLHFFARLLLLRAVTCRLYLFIPRPNRLTSFYVRFKETTVYRKVTLAQLKVTLAQLKVTLAQ